MLARCSYPLTCLRTYQIKEDCADFLREDEDSDKRGTWAKNVDVAAKIWTYSDNAGGDAEDSFYQNMLAAVNAYNEASSDEEKSNQKDLILEYTNMQTKDCTTLATAAEAVETELGAFQTRCSGYSTGLTGHENTMESILSQEYGDIQSLKADIEKQTATIKSKQSTIDAGKLSNESCLY